MGRDPRPRFFLIGAHRAATTSICNMLDQHPDLCISHPKEPGFFSWPQRWERGFDWYRQRFADCSESELWGECSTTYSQVGVFPEVPGRIAVSAPDARIIYSIRHPLDRIRSAWTQYRSQGRADVPADFTEAVRTVPQLVDASRYRGQIEAYLEYFPPARIRVILFDDVVARPEDTVRDCFEFLGVDPAPHPRQRVDAVNAAETKRADRAPVAILRKVPGMARLDPAKRAAQAMSRTVVGRAALGMAKSPPSAHPPAPVGSDAAGPARRRARPPGPMGSPVRRKGPGHLEPGRRRMRPRLALVTALALTAVACTAGEAVTTTVEETSTTSLTTSLPPPGSSTTTVGGPTTTITTTSATMTVPTGGAQCRFGPRTSVGLIPIDELGPSLYEGEQGGLYPGGVNDPPPGHLDAGLAAATQVTPRDATGDPDPGGKVVMISVGISNTEQEFRVFQDLIAGDPTVSDAFVAVNGAQGGRAVDAWVGPNAPTWRTVDQRLQKAGVTAAQVQVAWVKVAQRRPGGQFPVDAQLFSDDLATISQILRSRYPNLVIAYFSSRTYGGYSGLNPEPFAYQTGFGVKFLVERQIGGDTELNFDPAQGAAVAPWLAWGPYLWADGDQPRADGLSWPCEDWNDPNHLGPSGRLKVAERLHAFLATDPTACGWYLAGGCP